MVGENITSVKIRGNYLVLLAYVDEINDDKTNGPWTFCQAFPTKDDQTKTGPSQIKWEKVRNMITGQLPNYLVIIPTKNN